MPCEDGVSGVMVDAHSIVPKPSPTIRGRLLRSGQEDGGLADQDWHRRRRRACDAQSVSSDVAALAQVVADKLNLRASNTCKPRRGFEVRPCIVWTGLHFAFDYQTLLLFR